MTNSEKLAMFMELISPDTASTALLDHLLSIAEGIVLNRRYPYGPPEGATVPPQYDHIHVRIAVELFSKMGAEGQIEHSENGINRKYESSDVSPSLLRRIIPICGSVM